MRIHGTFNILFVHRHFYATSLHIFLGHMWSTTVRIRVRPSLTCRTGLYIYESQCTQVCTFFLGHMWSTTVRIRVKPSLTRRTGLYEYMRVNRVKLYMQTYF